MVVGEGSALGPGSVSCITQWGVWAQRTLPTTGSVRAAQVFMAPAPSPFHQFSAGIGWPAWYLTLRARVWERDRCKNRLPVTAQSHAAGPGHWVLLLSFTGDKGNLVDLHLSLGPGSLHFGNCRGRRSWNCCQARRSDFSESSSSPAQRPGTGETAQRTADRTQQGARPPPRSGPHRFCGKHSPGLLQEDDSSQEVFLGIS